jgi:zinc protease
MMRKSVFLAIAIAVVLICGAVTTSAQSFDVKTTMLKNGMKVMVQEDHTIPFVNLYIFYRIGSRNERPGTTGISHFFEHMMFNGAKKYGPGKLDSTMEENGGTNNAYTSYDVTVYQDWFPPPALETIFDIEADRIRDLAFDPDIIKSERGVVYSERRSSVDNNNAGLLDEQLWAAAFEAHPYHWPVVGWAVDIENWKMEDLRKHFEMGYSPSNATMVVVGDVTAEQVFDLARKYIEPIPSHDPPPKVTTQEPPQLGEHRVTVKKFAQLPLVMIAYHVPESMNADYYALNVLETILLSGQSSRLYSRLVDKDQLALSVNGGFGFSIDPTLFTITVQPKAGVDTLAVKKAIYEELDKLKTSGITDNDLEKAKNILLAGFYRGLKSGSTRANEIGSYEVYLGDYHKLFDTAAAYQRVTKEDIQRVARAYFGENNRTVATLVPDTSAQPPTPQKSGGNQ